jgi:hypothetical protein
MTLFEPPSVSSEEVPKTSSMLEQVMIRHKNDSISFYDLMHSLHDRGICLLLVLFSFPIAIPLPYPPGFTTILGMPLLMLSWQLMFNYDAPWMPDWIGRRSIRRSILATVIEKSSPFFRRYEAFSRRRFVWLCNPRSEQLVGLLAILCSISIILPIWLGNALPSAGILIMALGLLTTDGLVVLLGMVVSVLGIALSVAIVLGATKFIMLALDWCVAWLGQWW